jgi:hypothetical protein
VRVRVLQRALALTAAIWHNDHTDAPVHRPLTALRSLTLRIGHLGRCRSGQNSDEISTSGITLSISRRMASMGKYRKATKADTFGTEVRRWFGPLAAEWGMSDPVDDELVGQTVTYRLGGLSYRWLYDWFEPSVHVHVTIEESGAHRGLSLEDIVVAAGLGTPQRVRTDGKTWRAVQMAIESQTEWLGRLHPRLSGPDGATFLEGVGASVYRRDK